MKLREQNALGSAGLSIDGRAKLIEWVSRAIDQIDDDQISRLLCSLIEIPSPTGEEKELAEFICRLLEDQGFEVRLHPADQASASVSATIGSGKGPSLLMFAPLDTPFSSLAEEEVPWIGPSLRADHLAVAVRQGRKIIGLGANNPKGHISAIIVAATAVVSTALAPLTGSLILAFGAGGAPSDRTREISSHRSGHGSGCAALLDDGVRGDFAVVAKPGYAVSWEEAGLAWFKVRVHGDPGYVGVRHRVDGTSAIVSAAHLVQCLEKWFEAYASRHATRFVRPQGAVGAVQAGWPYKPSFLPAACDLYVDLRLAPGCTPAEAEKELHECIDAAEKKFGFTADCELTLSIPGAVTPSESWIVRSAIAAWEATESRRHEPATATSGQTEAVLIRQFGIPTARIGLPPGEIPRAWLKGEAGHEYTMGVVDVPDIRNLARCLVRIILDTCARSWSEVGLPHRDILAP